ncbi:hypothetical protein CEQ90_06720 [Lewinellaceae bacterium SD302]|nr:hypothetical protein CEQ90_06720 [Lewinellaceae bacterium SD302]
MDNYQSSEAEDANIRREVSLREIILVIRSYVIYLWRKVFWLLLFVLIGVAYFVVKANLTPAVYATQTSFMVNESDAGAMAGMGNLLSQFGFGGGAKQGGVNFAQLVELSNSRLIAQRVLFDSAFVNGRDDLLANHMIDVYEYHEYYREAGSTLLQDFYFTHDSIAGFSELENRMFLQLHYRLTQDDPPFQITYNGEIGIVTIQASSVNEMFTYHLVNKLYEVIEDFYTAKSNTPQARSIKVLQARADSLGQELRQREYQLSSMEDRTLGLIGSQARVRMSRIQREASLISGIYTEVLKNIETTRFMLNNAQPVFVVVDRPILPLFKTGSSNLLNGIVGAIFGGFFGVLLLVLIKIYRDVVHSDAVDRIVIQ